MCDQIICWDLMFGEGVKDEVGTLVERKERGARAEERRKEQGSNHARIGTELSSKKSGDPQPLKHTTL